MSNSNIDQPIDLRDGDQLNIEKLTNFLKTNMNGIAEPLEIRQFPGGFSNLTYAIQSGEHDLVMRRPPYGANIKSAHDMLREYRVLSLLEPYYEKIPQPVLYCEDEEVIGAPFYVMERVKGLILRNKPPKGVDLSPAVMQALSKAAIANLAKLHQIDLVESGLGELGKPEGYIQRQVTGWIKRYKKAQTDDIPAMDQLGTWLEAQQPKEDRAAFIHNDYKYDNLVLNP
ncbi:MAG: phosphotransferase family protein, partial [Bacteroidota bacterium]